MVDALHAAEAVGVEVEPEAYAGALRWFDSVTHAESGRIGYDAVGSLSARVAEVNDHFPPERGEAMTAVGLCARLLLGETERANPRLAKHVELLIRKPPRWAPEDFDCDMYSWYHATNALFRVGGAHWDRWHPALQAALLPAQRTEACLAGSWDPVGPWGYAGGRVYSTALLALSLQSPHRYPRGTE